MRAKDVMTRDVVTVSPDTAVEEVARTMLSRHVSGVPVVDADGRLVGLVSEGDLVRHEGTGAERKSSWWLDLFTGTDSAAAEYVRTHGRRASDVMTRNVVTVTEGTPLDEIASTLEKNRIKRVPVVKDDRVVGIVSRANLLHGLAALKPRRAVETDADDTEIRDTVERAIRSKTSVPAVNVIVHDGAVQLWGMVETTAERDAARIAAEEVPGVKAVESHITLMPQIMRASYGAH